MVSCKASQVLAGTTRASPVRLQNSWQSVTASIWLATATTARLRQAGQIIRPRETCCMNGRFRPIMLI